MRHSVWVCAAAAGLLAASPERGGSQSRPVHEATRARITGPLSLADAVQRALTDDPDIRISERAADIAFGAAISTHSLYDATIATSVLHSRQNGLRSVPATSAGESPTIESALTSSVTSSVTMQQRLPWGGVVLAPQVSMTSVGSPGTLAQSKASTLLGLTVPLARDRGGALSSSVDAAAFTEADATLHDLRQAASTGVYQTATAYWNYVAARRRLAVFITAEEHAKQNLEQTTQLVAADERPASDLVQLRGNVASKTSSRISAEQAVLEAWKSLASLLGVGDADVLAAPEASTDFPELPPDSAIKPALSPAELQTLTNDALHHRADLAAVSTRVHESELGVLTTKHLLRPIINVVAQAGYSGLDQGWGVQQFVSPLYRNRSPLNATLQLNYQFSAANSDAVGRSREAAAALDEQRELQHAEERAITTGVIVSLDGVRRSIASGEAVHLSTQAAQQTVDNELHKFRLGSSTVFDIILAEDNLTNALLGDVAGRQTYAAAIARAQYEMGTLVTGERQSFTANVAGLLHAPSVVVAP